MSEYEPVKICRGRVKLGRVNDCQDCRPVVAIDPEDREQVEDLCRRYVEAYGGLWDGRQAPVGHMQAALRSLITPPRPEEPTGLGAVVEDEQGGRWIKYGYGPAPWMYAASSPSNRGTYAWSTINAVKVLSEGVR